MRRCINVRHWSLSKFRKTSRNAGEIKEDLSTRLQEATVRKKTVMVFIDSRFSRYPHHYASPSLASTTEARQGMRWSRNLLLNTLSAS